MDRNKDAIIVNRIIDAKDWCEFVWDLDAHLVVQRLKRNKQVEAGQSGCSIRFEPLIQLLYSLIVSACADCSLLFTLDLP